MKINVTWSTDENANTAGKQCAKKAVLDLIQTKLAIIYSSEKYNTNNLLEGAKSIIGTAPIIGCTSSKGILTNEGYITSPTGFAGMMALGDQETLVTTAGVEKINSARETGRIAAIRAQEKSNSNFGPTYVMMIASLGDEEEYLRGIQDVVGDVPCFGGTAADDEMNGKWKIYTEDSIFTKGVAVAFFYTNKKIRNNLEGKYHETVNSGVVTKTTGNREIDEINDIQALKLYAEWTDKKVKDLRGIKLLEQSILKPLAVKSHDGRMTIIKQPLNGNTNYSMNVGNDVSVNTAVIQMQISKEEIVKSPSLIIRNLKEKSTNNIAFLISHSAFRKDIVEEDVKKINKEIKKEIGETPYLMAFTYGEYGKGEHTENICSSLMISTTSFGE